jgi:hypothetical protein
MIPIEIGEETRSVLSPTSIQVDSPQKIAAALLQPFQTGSKEILLVGIQHKSLVPATLAALHDTHLVAEMPPATVPRTLGERLLVIFPVLPQQQYIVETFVDEVQDDRCTLRYQGPRYDVRWTMELAAPVTVHLAPAVLVAALTQQQVHIVRELMLPSIEHSGTTQGHIADRLCAPGSAQSSPYMQLLTDAPTLSCHLKDIALGGVCLTLDSPQRPEELLHSLLLLHLALPVALSTGTLHLTLEPFGVIRGVRSVGQPRSLHVRFVQRLPDALTTLLAHLESHFLEQQRPLG